MTPQEILTKLQGLDGPDREVDIDLWHETLGPEKRHLLATFDGQVYAPFGFTASVDAALAFGEALIPGASYALSHDDGEFFFRVWHGQKMADALAPTLPLSILIAYLTAWIGQQK